MMNMLRIDSLSSGYDHREVIRDISFSVEKGDFIGIIGPNGAGKTTLFRSITGVLAPWQGTVLYKDKNIRNIPPRKFAAEVAVIPQSVEMPFAFTVEEFVFLGRFPHLGRFQYPKAGDYQVINKVLKLCDAEILRERKIFELSGGERQKVLLAQGFAQEPRLLLLDEPTAHLDITHQVGIMDLLKRLNREEGLTVVIILHDLNLASEYCQKIILLDHGRIFKKGGPEEVLTYQNIEQVYKTVVVVEKNPISSKPYVLVVSEEKRR
ncbi:MAG: ABC transporter ATP-binding protein [Candidatus Omnitrophota bacterium]